MDTDGLANFFLGLGVGVGIGLLFAPKSGEETRGLLKTKAERGQRILEETGCGPARERQRHGE